MPDTRTYKVDKDVYDIPMNEVDDFLVTYPKAIEVESYKVDKDTFDIPVKEVKEFLTQYPSAKPLKKKESSIPSPPTLEESLGKGLPLVPKGGTSQLPSEEPEWKPAYKQGEFYKGELDVTPETPEGFRNVGYPIHKTEIIRKDKEYNKKLKEISIIPKTVQEFTEKTGIDTKIQNPEKVLSQDEQVDLYKKNDLKEFIKKQSEKGYSKIQFEGEGGRITPEFLYKPEDSYWWAFMYGITDAEISALKTLSGATRILNNVSPAFRTTIKALNLPEGGLPEVLADKLEQAEKKGELLNKTPDNLLGDITRSVGQLSIDIPLIMMTPSAKLGYIESATGGLVKELPGLASYFGATNALQTYNEADKQGIPEVQKILQTTKALGIGVAEGALMHNFGYISGKTGDLVKGVTGSDILGRLTNITTNGGLFTGLTATEQLMSDKLNQRELVGSFILGAGLSMGELLKAKQKVATDRLLTETPENIRKINDVPYTVEELRQKQIEIEDLITKETNSEIKEQMQIASKTLDGYIDIKAVTKQILTDPASITKSINDDPKLSTEEKKYYTDKINQVVVENDPRLQTINPILGEVDKINRNIESVQNNELMNDVAKKATIKGLETRKEELDKEITKEMSKPLDIIELNKIEQEKSTQNEKQEKQQQKITKQVAKESENAIREDVKNDEGTKSQKDEILKPTENEKQEKGRQKEVLTGKGKDVTIQKQKSDEGVLRQERPEVKLQEVVSRDQEQKKSTEQGKKEKIKPEDLVIESKKESTPQVKRILRDKGNLFTRELKIRDESVGNITIKEGDNWMVKRVDVESTQQGKGIATETYRQLNKEAVKEGKVLTSDLPDKINNESKRIWESLVKSGEAEKLPDNTYRFKQVSVLDQELAKTRKEKLNEKEEQVKARLNERLQKLSGSKFVEGDKKPDTLKELYGVINDLGELGLIKIEKGVDHIITELKKYLPNKFDIEKYRVDIENEFVKKVKKETGIKLEETAKIREEMGMEEYQRTPVKLKELDIEAEKQIKEGYNISTLVSKVEKGYLPSALEQRIFQQWIASAKARFDKNPTPELEKEIDRTIGVADKVAGTELAQSLAARQGVKPLEDTLYDYFKQQKENSGVDNLTNEQKKVNTQEFEEITKINESYKNKLAEWEEFIAQLGSKPRFEELKKKYPRNARKTHDEFVSEREMLKKNIAEKWKLAAMDNTLSALPLPYAKQLAYITPDVIKLAGSYISEGIVTLKDVIDNIYENDLKDNIPGITKKDIHNILAGEYKEKRRTRQELLTGLKDLQEEAKLINKLEKLQQGIEPKIEKQKIERNRQITELRQQIKDFRAEKAKAEKEQSKLSPEERALKSLKTRTENQIKKLEQDLATGNFAQPEKRIPTLENKQAQKANPKLYKEVLELKDKQIQLKVEREIRLLKNKYNNRSKLEKVGDFAIEVAGIPRTLMASMDFSAPLRQGLVPTIAHPQIAMSAFKEMFLQAASEKRYSRWLDDLKTSPDYHIMKESGLYVADIKDPLLIAKEEQFMNNLAEKIPYIGRAAKIPFTKGKKAGGLIRGSARAYTSYLNKMRVDMFRSMTRAYESDGKTIANSKELYKATADLINNMTGRGGVGKFEEASKVLNTVFFSPRLIASRFNLLTNAFNPKFYTKVPKEVRVQYFKDMAKFIVAGTTVLAIAKLMGAEVEDNPRSSDFGKIKVGNTRYDIWGGFQQYVVLASRLLTGELKSIKTGEIRKLGTEYGQQSRLNIMMNFVRSKLAPVPATATNLLSGKNVIGEPVRIEDEALKSIIPLWAADANEALQDDGIKSLFTVGVPNIFGVGTQVYSDAEDKNRAIKKFNEKYNTSKIFDIDDDYAVAIDGLQFVNKSVRKIYKEKGAEEVSKYIQEKGLIKDISFYKNNSAEINNFNNTLAYINKQPIDVQKKYKSVVEKDIDNFLNAYQSNGVFEMSKDTYMLYKENIESNKEKDIEFEQIISGLK